MLALFNTMESCMQTCEKLERSRGASFSNLEELNQWLNYLSKHEGNPPKAMWTSNNFDGENWKDYFTGI